MLKARLPARLTPLAAGFGRQPFYGDIHVEGFARLRRQWAGHFDLLRAAEATWGMTTFPGYEIHSNTHGDHTILYPDLEPREPVVAESTGGGGRGRTRARSTGRTGRMPSAT